MMIRFNTILVLLLGLVVQINAQSLWKADPAHSNVQFEVTHLAISTVTGSFGKVHCTVKSDGNDFDGAMITASVNVDEISTENLTRDKHLKQDDFFNVKLFPEIKFISNAFKKVSDNKYELSGDLTIRDVTKKVTFPVEYSGQIALGKKVVSAFKANFIINRFDYGLKWNDTLDTGSLVVGEDVSVTLNLELVRQ